MSIRLFACSLIFSLLIDPAYAQVDDPQASPAPMSSAQALSEPLLSSPVMEWRLYPHERITTTWRHFLIGLAWTILPVLLPGQNSYVVVRASVRDSPLVQHLQQFEKNSSGSGAKIINEIADHVDAGISDPDVLRRVVQDWLQYRSKDPTRSGDRLGTSLLSAKKLEYRGVYHSAISSVARHNAELLNQLILLRLQNVVFHIPATIDDEISERLFYAGILAKVDLQSYATFSAEPVNEAIIHRLWQIKARRELWKNFSLLLLILPISAIFVITWSLYYYLRNPDPALLEALKIIRSDPQVRPLLRHITPSKNEQGKVVEFLIVFGDAVDDLRMVIRSFEDGYKIAFEAYGRVSEEWASDEEALIQKALAMLDQITSGFKELWVRQGAVAAAA